MAPVDPHLFIIFGGTGDLARRKLFPALYRLLADRSIAHRCYVLGVATTDTDDDGFRNIIRDALSAAGLGDDDMHDWCRRHVFYQPIRDGYEKLRFRIEAIEQANALPGNRAFYLALPPSVFPTAITELGDAGLGGSRGWTRLVIEKPFGTNLHTARDLNATVHRYFEERQIYRIDHYLGKETVQNLLNFRFSNPMFEALWNRDRVASVEITVAEEQGIGSRAGYYEEAGALRDMIQNHLTQLLALVAMEPPNQFDADRIRNEKVKVIEAIAPIERHNVVFGQYDAGNIDGMGVAGYRDEPGVAEDSTTPTFVGIKLLVDTWRWEGVPFFLRTGKRLPKRLTQIAVTFRLPPLCPMHGEPDRCVVDPNVLLITLQPDEGFSLAFNVKTPGEDYHLDSQHLHFSYRDSYRQLPDAYQTLILDVIEGDQTLFVRADEVEASWKAYAPLLDYPTELHRYAAGTWGPAELNQGVALGGREWMER
jgi:glucose-6-phosphate 1-dehydrogenase